MIYFIYCDVSSGVNISVRLRTRGEVSFLAEKFPGIEFIEVGPVSYWLMKHNMPKLAMLPFFG